jgi:hypothetical protein
MVWALKQATTSLPSLADQGLLQLHEYPPLLKDSVTCSALPGSVAPPVEDLISEEACRLCLDLCCFIFARA